MMWDQRTLACAVAFLKVVPERSCHLFTLQLLIHIEQDRNTTVGEMVTKKDDFFYDTT